MDNTSTDPVRYEWRIVRRDSDESEVVARYSGGESAEILELLFCMFLRDLGDVSDWNDREKLGVFVDFNTDLDMDVIAVWLCHQCGHHMYGADHRKHNYTVVDTDPPLEFEGPDGNPLRIEREVAR